MSIETPVTMLMIDEVCVDLKCIWCLKPIDPQVPYSCEIYDGEGTCQHVDCPEEEGDE